jgi:hypothetical protein
MGRGTVARWFGAASFAVYVIVGQRFGEQYPFSPLPMYAGDTAGAVGRVVVRRADGRLAEVTDFDRWSCPGSLAFTSRSGPCGEAVHDEQDEGDQAAADYVASHGPGPGESDRADEPVVIVRSVFAFDRRRGPLRTRTCDLVACTAAPR